jgi:hypothetical protein
MNLRLPAGLTSLTLSILFVAACGAPGGTPAPTPSPSPTPAPAVHVGSAAQAAALVFASDRRFAQMQPLRSDMIGQSSWFEATDDGDGYLVTITFGAGDCQAGCIQRHTYAYHVTDDGQITLVADEGDDINIAPAPGRTDPISLHVTLSSGPTCPVVTNPPDPNCADRAIANATVFVFNANGDEVAQGVTDADGNVSVQLPPGAYYVAPEPVEGLMGQAAAQAFSANGGDQVDLLFSYDTGIR